MTTFTAGLLDALRVRTPLPELIGRHVRLAPSGRLHVGCCPFHGERTPSFCVYSDHFHCFGCGAHGDVFDWLARTRQMSLREAVIFLGGFTGQPYNPTSAGPIAPAPVRAETTCREDLKQWSRDLAKHLWGEAVSPRDTAAEAYLRSRGLALPADAPLRFHPHAWRNKANGPPGPAMVALMTTPEGNEACGLHVTYLRPDGTGKAAGDRPKIMLCAAGVIRLVPDAEVTLGIGLAEGLETALAVMQRADWRPVWAATSAGAIARFPVLGGTECLTIFADADGAGIAAARQCCQRWADAGREACLLAPPTGDWDDRLVRREVVT